MQTLDCTLCGLLPGVCIRGWPLRGRSPRRKQEGTAQSATRSAGAGRRVLHCGNLWQDDDATGGRNLVQF